ncbi:1-deoxy-D-xylulose 5-phosphate reductoisomerase [Pseudonocardia sp. EC080610-09]|uniref:1-deoxy-D-xylulose-5-phosphate reductoisomerase n=1 Tax=unclassified Pseudonocardia TaxID=2619320 RepID=UPI0006CB4D84|nr:MULTISPECIES: 1-deoxy-D-xylulose-5-phosphate reductoisomerase [unclassified Pseudonocardia]ALE74482.1 1-deoxy-D-xylulose 5-phosphate reductoisomerase [Pseudonocardia sp. EC080625-04]ALL77905.1 1-deoxy-D-xylulose 5-phosphate reductoisomerase [Pseudonocardia sp. EC080610-09]ALL80818.1 1-deoxy-D-xylulose 5-phosphate reductoisomerase [Pseudonocardia sp. EC080619-01]
MKSLVVLGSTGSIGAQALDVIAKAGGFAVTGLAAGGSDVPALAAQAREHRVPRVAVSSPAAAEALREQLPGVEVLDGPDAATELVAAAGADIVLNGITGSRGLRPTLAALESGARLALANKESLVAGGPLVLAAAGPGQIVPVDSEHSALAQCLRGGRASEVDRLVLTASGGPFRGRDRASLADVTLDQALKHPTWDMGPVITINSATLVNKGLEVIEAHLLFGTPYDRIDVTVHPQSIVHSMVTFADGSTIAQASPPDMRLPIALALGWPDRLPGASAACDFAEAQTWTFEPLDDDAFPGVRLARAAGLAGGCVPAVLNAANEELVAAFVQGRIGYLGVTDLLGEVLEAADAWTGDPATVADVLAAEEWARAHAREKAAS